MYFRMFFSIFVQNKNCGFLRGSTLRHGKFLPFVWLNYYIYRRKGKKKGFHTTESMCALRKYAPERINIIFRLSNKIQKKKDGERDSKN